jgi:hypothetical protein
MNNCSLPAITSALFGPVSICDSVYTFSAFQTTPSIFDSRTLSRYTSTNNIQLSNSDSKLPGTPEPNANVMFPPQNQGYWTECSNRIEQQVKTIYGNLKQGPTHGEWLSDKGWVE